ncbi:MAG: HAD-superfamily hydrolase, subfamily variant 3 [Chlorobi bacterium]|nr:HAD-superfamily hydrolase, subfamily variant 3 [Chlorobiota bacterium]
MALDGIIFDIDGTLIDTNGCHVEAWRKAFERHGYKVLPDRIEVEIGKGGDHLVPSILGREADRKDGDALRKAQGEEFVRLAGEIHFKPYPGAAEMIEEVRRRGLKSALATSGSKKNLEAIERSSGLALTDMVDVVVTADDAASSKPAPDLVVAACGKLNLSPAGCAMLGDTIYDATACRQAGVALFGLLSGYNGKEALLGAGARTVYKDIGELLDHLDEALAIASPGPAHITNDFMERLMREALVTAGAGMEAGEAPIGAVLARGDGRIIARGYNRMRATGSKVAHAEMVTFENAAGKVPIDARDLLLVSTLEPCVMCTGAAMQGAVDVIVYGLRAPADSGTGRVRPPQSPENQMPRIIGDILAGESRALFEEWLAANGGSDQAPYIRQLLSLT